MVGTWECSLKIHDNPDVGLLSMEHSINIMPSYLLSSESAENAHDTIRLGSG